jgi:hypothetical protein
MTENRNAKKISIENPERKRKHGTSIHRWKVAFKLDLKEIMRKVLSKFKWLTGKKRKNK